MNFFFVFIMATLIIYYQLLPITYNNKLIFVLTYCIKPMRKTIGKSHHNITVLFIEEMKI